MADQNNSWSSRKPSSWDQSKKNNDKPQKKSSSWGSTRPEKRQNSWGNRGFFNLGPAMAGEKKQKVVSKGVQDFYNPQVERTKIIHKIKTLYNRGSFPFNRSPIMPNETTLQSRFNYLISRDMELHKYQEEGVRYLCSGSRRLLADGMGLGKATTLSTHLLTPSGWIKAIDINKGDYLIGQNGRPAKVLEKYIWYNVDFYKMKFHDGTAIKCCGDHLWSVMRKGRDYRIRKRKGKVEISDYAVMSTKELAERSLVQINKKGKGRNYNYYIPCVDPIQFEEKIFPIDPYVLGVYLGDGCCNKNYNCIEFTINENDIKIIGAIEKYFGHHNINTSRPYNSELDRDAKCFVVKASGKKAREFIATLKEFGLYGKNALQKFIPQQYKFGSEKQRWDLLCGLMDTDGTISPEAKANSLSFGSSSYKLIHGIRELVLSLGGIARIGKPEYKSYNLNGAKIRTDNASWRVGIKLPDNKVPFTIPRQLVKYTKCEKYDKPFKNIESIEYIGKQDGVCFKVDEPNSLFVAQHYIVTHNTAQTLASLPDPRVAGVIVVCPSSVRNQWSDEKVKWRPDLVTVMPPKKKLFRWPLPGEMVILGWDSLPTMAPNNQPPNPFVLVLDEAHFAKNDGSVRHRKILHFMSVADVVIGLTGTPQPNTENDLWNVLRVCGMQHIPGDRMPLLGPRSRFGRTFYKWEKGEKRAVGAEWELYEIIQMLAKRRTARDIYKELPPVIFNKREAYPDRKLAQQLDQFLAACGGEQRLVQILERAINVHENGGAVDDFLMALRAQIDMAKLPVLLETIETYETQGSHLVVFSPFRKMIDIIKQRPGWAAITGGMSGHEKQAVQRAFNEGTIKWLGITLAGATGVDLPGPDDEPCRNLIRTSLDWSPANNDQVVKRIDRFAKDLKRIKKGYNMAGNLQITDIYLKHRIDEIVWNVIHKKRRVLGELGFMADVDKGQRTQNYYEVDPERTDNVNIRFGGGGTGGPNRGRP